jgi:uncharacterized protein YsxB (DUF464 family)
LVEVWFREDGRKRLSSFLASGHAGWADAGDDVVCGAVSAILQSAWLGLSEVAKVAVTATRENGRLEVRWPEAARGDVATAAIARTAALSIAQIARQFPDHVRVVYEREGG